MVTSTDESPMTNRRHSPQIRVTGQRRLRRLTQLAIGAAVLGTGTLAALVAHETDAKGSSTATTPQSTIPASTTGSSGTTGASGTTGSSGATGFTGTSGSASTTGPEAPSSTSPGLSQVPAQSQNPHASSGGS